MAFLAFLLLGVQYSAISAARRQRNVRRCVVSIATVNRQWTELSIWSEEKVEKSEGSVSSTSTMEHPAGESELRETLVVGQVSHHSIELSWNGEEKERRLGPPDNWTCFRLEKEDPRKRSFHEIYVGFNTQFTVEDLEPNTAYKFRLKSLFPSGEHLYSPVLTVSTAREPINGNDLHQAVKMNDKEQLIKVLQSGTVVVDVPDRLGFTPLMVAARRGLISLVQVLVQYGADVNMKNSSGKDSLMLACFSGHLEVARYLLECGASWTSTDRGGCRALHWAADGGHLPVLEYLLQDGCEVDVRDSVSLWTPLLRVSAVGGNTAVAGLLISAGADINIQDKDGKTPLMVAVLNNHEELVKLLLENGADQHIKNEFGSGALEMAKAFQRKNIIPLLAKERPVGSTKKDSPAPQTAKTHSVHHRSVS